MMSGSIEKKKILGWNVLPPRIFNFRDERRRNSLLHGETSRVFRVMPFFPSILDIPRATKAHWD